MMQVLRYEPVFSARPTLPSPLIHHSCPYFPPDISLNLKFLFPPQDIVHVVKGGISMNYCYIIIPTQGSQLECKHKKKWALGKHLTSKRWNTVS